MSFSSSMCQLLGRRDTLSCADHLWIDPPFEPALAGSGVSVWTTDVNIAERYRQLGIAVHEGLYAPDDIASYAGILLFWPKSVALGQWWLDMLCAVLPDGHRLAVVGEQQGGIKRVSKLLQAMGMAAAKEDNARRCALFSASVVARPQTHDGWIEFEALGMPLASHPGVFGHGKLDEGTAMLLGVLPEKLRGSIVDVGCGGGIISAVLAKKGLDVTAVDVSHFALEATRRTLALNGVTATVLGSDMLGSVEGRFDTIISNPPFHQARDVDISPALTLFDQAPDHLYRHGVALIVANTFLPYKGALSDQFSQVDDVTGNGRFRVYRAASPHRFAR